MTNWIDRPPTYLEWKDAKNHGCWWVKFLLVPETEEMDDDGEIIAWPEVWHVEIVTIGMSSDGFKHIMQEIKGEEPDYSGIRLHGHGHVLKDFDLDDEKLTEHMYWQPVAAPLDDVKDRRPR